MSTAYEFGALEPPPPSPPPRPVLADPIGVAIGEAEAIREAARLEGFEAGREEALLAVRADAAPAAEALAAALAGAHADAADRARELEGEAVALALRIAEKVVAGAIAVRPEVVVDVVAGALRTLTERERVVVTVHPDDAPLVREAVDDVAAALGGIGHLDVQGDRRIGRGGAVVRTDAGEVEATIEAKLARAREAIDRELEAR